MVWRGRHQQPSKPDRDKMDAALCVLIALHWRLRPRSATLLSMI
jgi:predicted RNase H-like nuclease